MDVFYVCMQSSSIVAANSTSIIVSLCLMCRKKCFNFINHIFRNTRALHPSIVTQDTRSSYCSAITIFFKIVWYRVLQVIFFSNRKNKFLDIYPQKIYSRFCFSLPVTPFPKPNYYHRLNNGLFSIKLACL